MAEVLNEMQERLLPEYEQMQKFNVCTSEQLRECINKRKQLQTRIIQNKKSIQDFLDLIIFERKVHKWVCEKEKVIGKKLSGLKASIAKRIVKYYCDGLRSFPYEERFWSNYIQFSKKSFPHEVANIYERKLTYFGDNEKVWCELTLWTYEYSGNIGKVKEIFHRALVRHPHSEIINKAFFDILLAEAAKMCDEKNLESNTKSEQDFGVEILQLAYNSSKKKINNLNYFLSLLERCEETNYSTITKILQKQIIDDLMLAYPNDETLWDFLAQRELRGFSTSDLQIESLERKNVWNCRTEKEKIELCCKVYETAVETLKTEKMIDYYLDAMLKLNEDSDSELPFKRKRLAIAFKSGYETCLISDEHLDTYIRMLLATDHGLELAKKILEKLAPKRPTLKFFELWLNPYIVENDEKKVYEIFVKAADVLDIQSIPIWKKVLLFYKNQKNNHRLKQIYQEGSRRIQVEFGFLRAEYLEYTFNKFSIVEARKLYKDLQQLPPQCLELHQKILELEAKVQPVDCLKLRLCYESMVHLFGKTNPEVWIQFINFEKQHGDPKNISRLYRNAVAALDPFLVDGFISNYTLLSS